MGILEFKDVNKGFGEGTHRAEVLKNITLSVKEGEFLAILGFSGTGKSTLMNLIAGLEMPDSGALTFRGAPIAGPGPDRGLVFQSYSLMPWLTVRGNIMLAVDAVHGKLTRAEKTAKVDHYIAMVGLTHAAHRRPAELSGGMRQRVAVARALAMEPDLLLLDEPLSALDALTRANLADEILDIWEEDKKTCVLITNDVDEAILLADRIIVLNPDGTLADPVPVTIPRPRNRDAMNHDAAFKSLRAQVTQYLMDVGIAAKVEETRHLPNVTPIHQTLPAVVSEARVGMIEERFLDFSQLHKVYPTPKGPLTVVEDFDLKVNQGEFISLIGHSGCGKSTVLTMAAGLNAISKGAIKLDGRHVQGADPERAVVFQSPNLFPWLTAKENVAIGVDKVYPRASQTEKQEVVEYYLERVGLADAMDRGAHSMSNGMKQRVGIARAFALSPKLLLLDEPFGMLDSLTRWELQEVLMEVWSRTKVTAICVTHDVDEAILLADRVVMMTNGPQATIGKITQVDLPRPRTRKALLAHPDYYTYRQEVLDFLTEYEHGAKPAPKPKPLAAE
ncbi:ABC transporter ATP-binding protein [Sulfitobacter pseudonitzschiae]|uniref:ABC transporter ATP-binding protein n=1 Tax=Pseudosulfitobacter pseudonitzschiae TaxID=1402135 RepID=A0A9Q2S1I8_9RHOB|nr:ABC transporter ATP-binding protein [Pseudosulfitobacter pseudonitzschiae]MBM2293720.1 ABC transporter ATP-binding protein [Pseudosulfitobacter pseudonitzschiae]MBM2298534.1 ABC transporter ATP-binding protein [Pseudosulfitobacter pseudonitzschiae]MBM2303448.1 ABC transporter ATP-binding protein [Pseudosulfitobacter pseudonitzschiae]MBM2313231.1 ABC transporter ATP-binding protein [Pseudosulfitobacter pseudonitzschiae]MBM2318144.1 ABC transporter ATP-binding protein [Pseudosulfitobacter pse